MNDRRPAPSTVHSLGFAALTVLVVASGCGYGSASLAGVLGNRNGDLRTLPLLARKALLREIIPKTGVLRFADHIPSKGEALFEPEAYEALERIFELLEEDDSDGQPIAPQQELFDVEFEAEADLGWRIYAGPVLDGVLIVYAPGISAFGSDHTTVILFFVILLSLPAIVVGLIFGLRAQRQVEGAGQLAAVLVPY